MDGDTLQAMLREAVKETVTEVLQFLLEADRDAFLRKKGGRKNGHYSRKLEAPFGQVERAIPRDRKGNDHPTFLQPYARRQGLRTQGFHLFVHRLEPLPITCSRDYFSHPLR
jgi:putative transposase